MGWKHQVTLRVLALNTKAPLKFNWVALDRHLLQPFQFRRLM
jgi:hypothetical protein